MSKIKTYEFRYDENIDGSGYTRFCDETERGAMELFKNWQKENGYNIAEYSVEKTYDGVDAEEYRIQYVREQERAKLLRNILLNLEENFYYSGEDKNGKAFAKTDSEVAADALMETLYNLGFKIEGDPDVAEPDYKKEEFTVDGSLRYRFTEL